jgi:hypothetical protein
MVVELEMVENKKVLLEVLARLRRVGSRRYFNLG